MRLGGHLPTKDPLTTADELGLDAIQIHVSSPRTWAGPVGHPQAEALAASGRLIAVHAPYLINPASADAQVRRRSGHLLQATIDEADRCGAAAVVVHAGSAGADGSVEEAVQRWVDAWPELDSPIPLLLENTASGRASPGRHLADLKLLLDALRSLGDGPRVGVCLDTAHAFAGDPDCAADPAGWVRALSSAADGIALVHVNDSAVGAGAGRDRHANLAEGRMGLATLADMLHAADAPAVVLETPGYDERRRRDLEILRFLVGRGG